MYTFLLKSGHGYNMALRKRNYTFSSYLWANRPTCACGWFRMRAVKRRQNMISQEMFKGNCKEREIEEYVRCSQNWENNPRQNTKKCHPIIRNTDYQSVHERLNKHTDSLVLTHWYSCSPIKTEFLIQSPAVGSGLSTITCTKRKQAKIRFGMRLVW